MVDKKIDPFDVEALEKSVNDSATRVSAIWVSFLIFGLYLVIAAGTVTHRQLFLEDRIKLPVLNIDLPLVGFFFLAPALFVILHAYVLLQVLLLGRTAAAYNEAVDRKVRPPPGNASMRQRLANTLFAQIFAGSPRERDGWLGWLLKAMAWLTLAIAPVLVLLVFQFKFLPYHSHLVTWTLRVLILVELTTVFLLWPLALNPSRDIEWRRAVRNPFAWASIVLFGFVSLSLFTFPGEPHVNRLSGQPLYTVQCKRWFQVVADPTVPFHQRYWAQWQSFDRLNLPRVDVVDDERLKEIEGHAKVLGERDYQGERTQHLRGRDFNCADFSDYADLSLVDLADASLQGVSFRFSKLQGANLSGAELQGANLTALLQGASLASAKLQGATLSDARLQGANLKDAKLQGANLKDAKLQGAVLLFAELPGADLSGAELQGANLTALLQGASLAAAELQGADLGGALLQGANLKDAKLQGANLPLRANDDETSES